MNPSDTQKRQAALLIDIGNSRIKWAWLNKRQFEDRGTSDHIKRGLPARMLKTWATFPTPEHVVVTNVCGPEMATTIADWVQSTWSLDVRFVLPRQRAFGVNNAYTDPEQLGSDRWANLIAARQLCRQPICIIDCGTALTVDALDGNGKHMGGLIMPGMGMMSKALHMQTRGISEEALNTPGLLPTALLASDTSAAVQGGILYTMVATIDRLVTDICDVLGDESICLITGGDANQILPLLAADYRHEPDLMFKGMALLVKGR